MSRLLHHDFCHTLFLRPFAPVLTTLWLGETPSGDRRFEISTESGLRRIHLAEVILAEERALWDSVKEIFDFAIREAEAQLYGTYVLELVCAGEREKLRNFDGRSLASLLLNHGRSLSPGEERLFPYASLWLAFKKLVPADWGKIRFQHSMTVYSQERAKFDLFLKKRLQAAAAEDIPVWLLIRDFSQVPLFRFGEEEQTSRLRKVLEKNAGFFAEKIQGVLIVEESRVIDLVEQFEIRGKTKA